ncbi:two component response regulator protein [Herbaspirillum sp. GW103]|jgi:response regulator RpfG family c-di-GMP phosphodiesterase|uniref:HD domain-containing phosphohydrolase n=1 Tax=unclassified Herbaspirillum TaxID=2624150 RepID=UPI00025E3BAF|nr:MULTISPECIES: HD domain-containing phosphohydrolase [unclassified Herbaspirillum]EIJ46075.1 two component response regulator protein [Herbaspirillum sp. GW103]MCI1003483.1 response regulator [Herbaspirillum sp. C7C8]
MTAIHSQELQTLQQADPFALPPPCVLLVDDEQSILSALKRSFRPLGYRLLTATSAEAGLDILASAEVDLVISDMRMPGMNGAQFLAQVKQQWPATMRILLTGYSEIGSTISAINDGGIHHYLSKPWEDRELLMTVAHALEEQQLRKQKMALERKVREQNLQLADFTRQLERQVQARTEELRQTVLFLESAQEEEQKAFLSMLHVFSDISELRAGLANGQSARIARWCEQLAMRMGMTSLHARHTMMAGMLHGIGKLDLSDELVRKPIEKMSSDELQRFLWHPVKGQMLLTPIPTLAESGEIIRHQHERYDGRGVPESLSGDAIPLGSRILAVVRDFEGLCNGGITSHNVSPEKALTMLRAHAGHRYDPLVVETFIAMMEEQRLALEQQTRLLAPQDLRVGMKLAEDLRTRSGVLLLNKEHVLDEAILARLRRFEQIDEMPLKARILLH